MVQMVKVVPHVQQTHFVVVVHLYPTARQITNPHLLAIRRWPVCVHKDRIIQIQGVVKTSVVLG
jgi:hypothetical protein